MPLLKFLSKSWWTPGDRSKSPSARGGFLCQLLLGSILSFSLIGCDVSETDLTGGRSSLPVDFDFEYIDRSLAGLWRHVDSGALLRLVPDGRFSLFYAMETEGTVVMGRVSEIEEVLRFLYDPSIPICVGVIGKYVAEEVEGEDGEVLLELNAMEDSCEERKGILSGRWHRIEGLTRTDKAEEAAQVDFFPQEE